MPRPMCFVTSPSMLLASAGDLMASEAVASRLALPITGSGGALVVPMRSAAGAADAVVVMSIARPLPMADGSNDLAQRVAWPGWQQAAQAWRSHLVVSEHAPR